ncbi:MAG: HAMP domain-containing protein [Alphaproteobacteria bacterium]|nr:HAMP domain-containing protein [Alphaproteobacteria bacterium]MBL7097999.1 HAMP domain-containing protein [Alphaproteobacteria bacterium]
MSQTESPDAAPPLQGMARYDPWRFVKPFLPRGLFWRSLIIIVAPVVLLQGVMTYVFFERHLDQTTHWMARDIAADAAFLVSLEQTHSGAEREALRAQASRMLDYPVTFQPGAHVSPHAEGHKPSTIDRALDAIIAQQVQGARAFEATGDAATITIRIELADGVLRMAVPRSRVTVTSPDVFIIWMAGSALVLMGIAVLFLRNQVRPIERLALAAEAFGKGRTVPDYHPYGATEVRRAARAFMVMRQRIERQLQQRTEMLAGISHDLKTPLSRMKLQLAMMPESTDIQAMRGDIAEMEHMLNEYLEFARGEGGEQSTLEDLSDLARDAAAASVGAYGMESAVIAVEAPGPIDMYMKRKALRRCATNLIDNALKFGKQVKVSVMRDDRFARIIVDDDGPGIPAERRDEAFRPFHRLDEGRNLQTGGSGLGLAIARDIARAHGGDILLDKSPLGGLRATIRLPV